MKTSKTISSRPKARRQASGCDRGVGDCSKSESPTVAQRTDALLQGLEKILMHHNAKPLIRQALNEQCHSYLDSTNDEMVWLKRCKYLLTFPLARYLRNELPPKPDVDLKFTGKLRIWIKNRLNAVNVPNYHLWYSWFQAKRSTLPLSEDVVERAYDAHLETLTRADPGVESTIDEIFNEPTFMKVLSDVKKSVEDYLRNNASEFTEMHPKNSACFEFGRKDGGQAANLRWQADLKTYVEEDQEGLCDPPELYDMVYRPWVYTPSGKVSDFTQQRYAPYGESEWSSLRSASADLDLSRPVNCTIQAVLEPNKIRVISKGESLPYYSCRPLQRALFEALKKIESFVLISRPLSPTDLLPLYESAQKDWDWFSVDYSAATDGLSWNYSGKIFRRLIEDLSPRQKALAERVLGPHNLHYPPSRKEMKENPALKAGGCVFKGVQQNGQLMGSILSFPILCLANLGVYLLATKDLHDGWSMKKRLSAVKINGDDMLYCAPKCLWERHVKIGKEVGLEMSIGKAYIHHEYSNINSQSFLIDLRKKNDDLTVPKIRMVNFLNVGLFFGRHKVQGKSENMDRKTAASHHEAKGGLVVNINELLRGALPRKKCAVLKEFLAFHKEAIKSECTIKTYAGRSHTKNLFIPEALGGMGVDPPEGWYFRVKTNDVYIAHGYLKRYPNVEYTTERPLPGWPIEKIDEPSVPWAIIGTHDPTERIPEHRIKIKQIKKLCRSTGFEFYTPYSGCKYTGSVPNQKRVKPLRSQVRKIHKENSFDSLDDLIALNDQALLLDPVVGSWMEDTLSDNYDEVIPLALKACKESKFRNWTSSPFSWCPPDTIGVRRPRIPKSRRSGKRSGRVYKFDPTRSSEIDRLIPHGVDPIEYRNMCRDFDLMHREDEKSLDDREYDRAW